MDIELPLALLIMGREEPCTVEHVLGPITKARGPFEALGVPFEALGVPFGDDFYSRYIYTFLVNLALY